MRYNDHVIVWSLITSLDTESSTFFSSGMQQQKLCIGTF